MAASMRSARLHEPGQPLRIDTVEIPGATSARWCWFGLKACGIIPNMNANLQRPAVEITCRPVAREALGSTRRPAWIAEVRE